MNSPEQAIGVFINEVSKECLLATMLDCEKFLDSRLTIQQKENFIQENTEIYFEAIDLLPTQWLHHLVIHMKEAVKTK